MSIHSLPPEILLHVFSLTLDKPFLDTTFSSHRLHSRDLLSFSLVHSTWSRVAQSLLVENLFLRGGRNGVSRTLRAIVSEPFKSTRVKRLVWGGGEMKSFIFEDHLLERWKSVVTLVVSGPDAWVKMHYLANLPNLKTLCLMNGNFDSTSLDASSTFPRLRELIVGGFDINFDGQIEELHHVYSKHNMPNLRHVSLVIASNNTCEGWRLAFEPILEQLTSLAIRAPDEGRTGGLTTLSRLFNVMANLAHLSIQLPARAFPSVQTGAIFSKRPVDLQSLHLQIVPPPWGNETPQQIESAEKLAWSNIASIVKRDGKVEIQAGRVYVYGKRKEEVVRSFPGIGLETVYWRKGDAPFSRSELISSQ